MCIGVTIGFMVPQVMSVSGTNEVSLEIQLGGNEIRCLINDGNIVLLLQLVDGQGKKIISSILAYYFCIY